MTSYTITVAPTDDTGNTTTIIVDMSGDEVRITDVHLHASAGLTAIQLPAVDVSLLMRAVAPHHALAAPPSAAAKTASSAAADTASAATVEESGVEVHSAAEESDAGRSPGATEPVATEAAKAADEAPSRRPAAARGRRRRAKEEPAPASPPTAAEPRTRRRSRSGASAEAATQKKTPSSTEGKKERVYRRMPEDFSVVARRLNGASVIAEHYEVPRHTAEGWLRRLRAATAG